MRRAGIMDVTLQLRNVSEMGLVYDVVEKIDALRQAEREEAEARWRELERAPVTPTTPVAPPVFPIAQRVEDDTAHAERVRAATAAVVQAHGPALQALATGPTPAEMEEAAKTYGRKHGFEKARALLDEYTSGKVRDVPLEKRPELYAKLTA